MTTEQPKAPPATFAGFSLRKNVAGVEASCTEAGLAWQSRDDGHFSCSGTPLDLGAPATVKVTACSGAISEVAVNAGSDGAAWGVLAQRAIAISRLLAGRYGNPHAHDTNLLSDCNEESKSCFAKGRARTTTIWRWAGNENLKITLDGGPPGSPPSLTVVYATAAPCQAKPPETPPHG